MPMPPLPVRFEGDPEPLRIDLHMHSTASDGALPPAEVVALCAARGLTHMALTDHDTLEGVAEAAAAARREGLVLIPGTELSTQWRGIGIHVVGAVARRRPGLAGRGAGGPGRGARSAPGPSPRAWRRSGSLMPWPGPGSRPAASVPWVAPTRPGAGRGGAGPRCGDRLRGTWATASQATSRRCGRVSPRRWAGLSMPAAWPCWPIRCATP